MPRLPLSPPHDPEKLLAAAGRGVLDGFARRRRGSPGPAARRVAKRVLGEGLGAAAEGAPARDLARLPARGARHVEHAQPLPDQHRRRLDLGPLGRDPRLLQELQHLPPALRTSAPPSRPRLNVPPEGPRRGHLSHGETAEVVARGLCADAEVADSDQTLRIRRDRENFEFPQREAVDVCSQLQSECTEHW